MGGSMAGYRIFRIGKQGHFVGVYEVSATSDADAMLQAHKLLDGLDLEVWHGTEKIGYLRSEEATAKSAPGATGLSNTPRASNTPEADAP